MSSISPLEALLTCQYLYNYGVSSTVFGKISTLLLNDEQIRRSPSFDSGRLSPDALRDFYLGLLKEEARNEVEHAHDSHGSTNGDASQMSRKRKAPSPNLPTIQDASKNSHLMPQLIQKLYARYREHANVQIKEDERRYGRLRQDLDEIKRGAWDERIQQEIEQEKWEELLKRKGPADEKKPDGDVNGAVKPPPVHSHVEVKPDQRQQSHPPQNATPAISPRPQLQAAATQSPAISPRHTPQPNILPAPGNPQQPAYAQPLHHSHPPISPRPPDARGISRPAQSPMLPPPPPTQAGSPLPPYPYANTAQLPPHSPYAPPAASSPQYQGHVGQYPQYPPQPQSYTPYAGAQGGVILQPFSVAPQTPTGPRPATGQTAQSSRHGPTSQAAGLPPLASQQTTGFSPFDIAKLLTTPITAKKLPAGSPAASPSKDTVWKPLPGRAARGTRKSSPEPPRSRSVSPISQRAISPPAEPETTRRSRRGKPLSAVPESVAPSRSGRIRRVRGGSTASSVHGSSVRGRTRSQSVMSHMEDVSMVDTESISGRKVKHEPSTPMESSDVVHPTTEGTPNQAGRRGYQVNKRKRGLREDSEASDVVPLAPRQDKSVVIANKNFNRLCQTIMNDIQSHKHASLFSNPVRDKDAEGYSDIIRRPQDLKSIRTAITAGNRAVNAATASDSFASSTTSQPRDGGGIIVLPVNEDLVPPKAIVNPGQLEKEVMRMFANAVMFNPGDDGVVHDAREMAKDVEGQIAKFREVERSSGATATTLSEGGTRRQSEIEGEDEDTQVGIKRRKVQ